MGDRFDHLKQPDWVAVLVDGFPVCVVLYFGFHGAVALAMDDCEGLVEAFVESVVLVLPILVL